MGKENSLSPILELNFPLEYRAELCTEIFANITKRESFTLVGMKDNNKKNVLRFIAFRDDVRQKYLGDEVRQFRFAYVDSNELPELNVKSVLQLLARRLSDQLDISIKHVADPIVLFDGIRKALVEYSQTEKVVIILMFNNFEVVSGIENSRAHALLTALREAVRYGLVYVLTSTRPLIGEDFFINKVVWAGLFNERDAMGVIERNSTRYGRDFSEKETEEIINLSGSHPGLIKYVVQNYEGLGKWSYDDWLQVADITTQCRRIVSVLTSDEINDLQKGKSNSLLLRLGMQRESDRERGVFSPLFEQYLITNYPTQEEKLAKKRVTSTIFDVGTILQLLTPHEEALFTLLIAHEGDIVTREMIIEHVWDRDLPSDWAIDQLISRLRKKLILSSLTYISIRTIRARGILLKANNSGAEKSPFSLI